MTRRILIFGYYGMSNIGSEARLPVIIDDIRKADPDAAIDVAAFKYFREEHFPGIRHIKLKDAGFSSVIKLISILKNYDVVINGEGIPYVDFCGMGFLSFFLPVMFFASMMKKKTVSYCFDVDHLTKLDAWLTKQVLKKTDLLIVRTEESKRELEKLGIEKQIFLTADPALLFESKAAARKERRKKIKIGISFKDFFCYPLEMKLFGKREWLYRYPYYYTYKKGGYANYVLFIDRAAIFCRKLIEQYDADVHFIIMEHLMDHKINTAIYDRLKSWGFGERISLSDSREGIYEIKNELDTLDYLITTRLHAVILSMDKQIPSIAISSDERFEYLFRAMDLKENCIDFWKHKDLLFEKVSDRLDYTLKNKTKIRSKIDRTYRELRKKAEENHIILKNFLENIRK